MKKIERRAVARYREVLTIDVEMDGYDIKEATSIEVSLAGVRLACEGPVAGKVLNKYVQVTPGANIIANLQIKIPSNTGIPGNICCKCRVISVNRVSQDCYHVGFNILEFSQGQKNLWQNYISNLEVW